MLADIFTSLLSTPWLLALTLVVLQGASYTICFRYARYHRRKLDGPTPEGIGIIGSSVLGLAAFVLALTLSLAISRMQDRSGDGWTEANALRAAWEQANAVGGEQGTAIAAKLEAYSGLRRDSLLLDYDDPRINEISVRIDALQLSLWSDVMAIVSARSDDVTAMLMGSVSQVTDATTNERLAVSNQMPMQINLLMLILVFAGMGVVGYQVGMTGHRHPVLTVLLIGVWTYIVLLIVDIGDSRAGTFRTSTAAYELVLSRFAGGPD